MTASGVYMTEFDRFIAQLPSSMIYNSELSVRNRKSDYYNSWLLLLFRLLSSDIVIQDSFVFTCSVRIALVTFLRCCELQPYLST